MTEQFFAAKFLKSCASPSQLPAPLGPEVAFAGRSNSGKSSTLNRLCRQRGLARVSKTPGRTQQINFFGLPSGALLVDLPGYGFAKVPEAIKMQWHRLIEDYLANRTSLSGLLLIMDIRHPLTALDQQLIDWCGARSLPAHILLNKADKLGRGVTRQTIMAVERALQASAKQISVQSFSAETGEGLEELERVLTDWLRP